MSGRRPDADPRALIHWDFPGPFDRTELYVTTAPASTVFAAVVDISVHTTGWHVLPCA